MGSNAFLVRYAGGWAERTDTSSISTYGRIEAFLGLGALNSLAEVNRVADGQLALFKDPREQTDIAIDPRWAAEQPYHPDGVFVGDTVTVQGVSHRILGMAISEDQHTGRVIYVPSVNDNVVLDPLSRIAQALTKMVRGTLGGRSRVAQPWLGFYQAQGRAPNPIAEICESFTVTDGVWDGAADLGWTITVANQGDLNIISDELTFVCDSLLIGPIGAATTSDYGVTSADCWAEFDFVDIGDDNYPTRAVSVGDVAIGLRADAAWDYDAPNDNAIVFVLETYGSVTSSFPGPSWVYYVYDGESGPTIIDGSAVEIEGTPVGHWRFEVEGDECRMYLDGVLFDSGNVGAIGDYGRDVGVSIKVTPEITPPSDTRGATIDNLCAGDL